MKGSLHVFLARFLAFLFRKSAHEITGSYRPCWHAGRRMIGIVFWEKSHFGSLSLLGVGSTDSVQVRSIRIIKKNRIVFLRIKSVAIWVKWFESDNWREELRTHTQSRRLFGRCFLCALNLLRKFTACSVQIICWKLCKKIVHFK